MTDDPTVECDGMDLDSEVRYPCKVGISKNPGSRRSGISTGSYRDIRILWTSFCAIPFALSIEKKIHQHYHAHHLRREWFSLTVQDIQDIEDMVEVAMYQWRMIEDYGHIQKATDASDDEKRRILQMITDTFLLSESPDFVCSQEQVLHAYARPMRNAMDPNGELTEEEWGKMAESVAQHGLEGDEDDLSA